VVFTAFFAAAQRLRCAAAIRSRASVLSFRFFLGFVTGAPPALAFAALVKTAFAASNLRMSASIAKMMDCVSIQTFLKEIIQELIERMTSRRRYVWQEKPQPGKDSPSRRNSTGSETGLTLVHC
jgi:hypothetical protein